MSGMCVVPLAAAESSSQASRGIGIGVGAGVGGTALLVVIAAFLVLRKRRAEARKEAYKAAQNTPDQGRPVPISTELSHVTIMARYVGRYMRIRICLRKE